MLIPAMIIWASSGSSGSNPPECVTIRVIDNSGNGPLHRLTFCGSGGGADSPLPDRLNGRTFIVDGSSISAPHSYIFGE
jgi:hypothetical protein